MPQQILICIKAKQFLKKIKEIQAIVYVRTAYFYTLALYMLPINNRKHE